MSDQMEFPETFDEFAEGFGFKDREEIYTNGAELIPVFRVKQWIEHDIQLMNVANKWIPVTEDIPPKGTICLWCNKQGSVFTSAITYRSENNSYVGKHGYFSNGLENYGDIIAWMPLPKPYKAESEE